MASKVRLEKLAQPLESVVEAGKQTVESVVKASTEVATKNYEKAFAATQEQLEKATNAAFQSYDELTALGKENLDALVRASTVLVKGFETLGKEFASYNQASIEKGVANAQALFGVKTVRELVELQTGMARETFELSDRAGHQARRALGQGGERGFRADPGAGQRDGREDSEAGGRLKRHPLNALQGACEASRALCHFCGTLHSPPSRTILLSKGFRAAREVDYHSWITRDPVRRSCDGHGQYAEV